MKKIISLFLVIVLALSCCGCGKTDAVKKKKKKIIVVNNNSSEIIEDENSGDENLDDETYFEANKNYNNQKNFTDFSVASKTPVKKITSAELGNDYFIVKPSVEHPGVVEMDATYDFVVMDKSYNEYAPSRYVLTTNNSNVRINDNKVVVPYSVRKSNSPVTITVIGKNNSKLKGRYTFNFQQFSDEPTLYDEFDSLNSDIWFVKQGEKAPTFENGNMVFRINKTDKYANVRSYWGQAYGCFSARISMPTKGLGNSAFWLCTFSENNGVYKKNPALPQESGGEIDIIEYIPGWGNRYSRAMHWFGWSPGYTKSLGHEYALPYEGVIPGNYQIYSAVWTRSAVYWYFNGQLAWTYTEKDGDGIAKDSDPMRIIIGTGAIQEEHFWGADYDPDGFPFEMKTDWVKAYSLVE